MSRPLRRRNANIKALPTSNKPYGPNLMFKWSIAGANSFFIDENLSFVLSSMDPVQSSQQNSTNPSPINGAHSPTQSTISTHKVSHLPPLNKKQNTSRPIEDDRESRRSSPLSLSYEQLHQLANSPVRLVNQNSFILPPISDSKSNNGLVQSISDDKVNNGSVHSITDDKGKLATFHPVTIDKQKNGTNNALLEKRRNSQSSGVSKQSLNSKATATSTNTVPILPKPTTTTISTVRHNQRLSRTELVRLHTPQLRRLNVSEKYMAEAKKLYFNAYCKSFVPRVVM